MENNGVKFTVDTSTNDGLLQVLNISEERNSVLASAAAEIMRKLDTKHTGHLADVLADCSQACETPQELCLMVYVISSKIAEDVINGSLKLQSTNEN